MQSCKYGVPHEYSSREILEKISLSCLKHFLCFFLVLLAKMRIWWIFLLFGLLMGPQDPHRLHPSLILYIQSVLATLHAVDGHMGPPLG